MANMDYCRFENTANDLEDFLEHFDDFLSTSEMIAKHRISMLAYEIVQRAKKGE